MATLPGGPSATIPLEFQALWIAKLLIEVLRGAAVWVRIEPSEAVVRKAECIVRRPDGTTEAHQCKRQRASKGVWSAADLESEGIISAACQYLTDSPQHHFWFISGDPAPAVRTLCERASQFDSLGEFRAEATSNKETRRDFGALVAQLGIDPGADAELAKLVDYLRRFHPTIEDVSRQRHNVEELASRWVEGEPRLVVHTLEHLANTTVRRQLDATDLKTYLEANRFRLRDLTKDANLPLRLGALCDRFKRSFEPFLIGGQPIGRNETEGVLSALDNPSTKVVLVHGSGGSGKSGILFETLNVVLERGAPALAIRLDQDDVGRTPEDLGEGLDLPASPVTCLASAAGGRMAVLFIDQLDAVRWTSGHSTRALDVVVEIIEAARAFQEIKIVIACRTFDASDDERIRTLFKRLENEKTVLRRIEATFSDGSRDALLEGLGISVQTLSNRQRETLRSVQNIWLLAKLHAEVGPTSFASGTDLNRKYWAWVRRQLPDGERISLDEGLIPKLVDGRFLAPADSVPANLQSRYGALVDRLLSIGALTRPTGNSIRFAHQTQYDYLAAERLAEQLRAGTQNLTDWLVGHDELFHRNQLRQLLEMLRDDDRQLFLNHLEAVVQHSGVCFHLKHLALQVLGSADSPPTNAELDLLLRFDLDPALSPHVRQLLYGKVGWFDLLHARGLISKWAESRDEKERAYVAWLMRPLLQPRGETIHAVTLPLDPDVRRHLLESVLQSAKVSTLCDPLFAAYIRLVKLDSQATVHLDLKALAQENPRRAIAVFRAQFLRLLRSLGSGANSERHPELLEHALLESREVMDGVARQLPTTCWTALWPVVERCQSLRRKWRSQRELSSQVGYQCRRSLARLSQFVEHLLTTAGSQLSRTRPQLAWRRCGPHLRAGSRMSRRIALKSLRGMPKSEADRVLGLLAGRSDLLTCGAVIYGSRYRAPATFPARQLIRRFADSASADAIEAVERSVRALLPKHEMENWRFAHQYFMGQFGGVTKYSIYPRKVFATQYALLDAFPANRLTAEGKDWFGVLFRRFGRIEAISNEPPRSRGGAVTSSIPEDRARRMSNRSWLRLVQSTKISPDNRFRGRNAYEFRESTPELFARQLEHAAHLDPSRFAELAMKIPLTVRPEYLAAILRALGNTKPPEQATSPWSQASVASTEAVLSRFASALEDRQVAMNFCWVLHNRPQEPWARTTIDRLVGVATSHHDPEGMEASVFDGSGSSSAREPYYVATAINCARGVAAWAVGALLFSDAKRLPLLRRAIDVFPHDPHPSVRIAATRIALSLFNLNRDAAVAYCLDLNLDADFRVLEGAELSEFLSYSLRNHFAALEPLIRRMLTSDRARIAEIGAEWATLSYLYDGRMKGDLEQMRAGPLAHRKGMAQVLSRELVRGSEHHRADDLLISLFGDPAPEVQGTAARVLWHPEFYQRPNARHILEAFASSSAALRELDDVLHGLSTTAARLDQFADAIGALVDQVVSVSQYALGAPVFATFHLPDVLLRLYEESEAGSVARKKCLDYIDAALRDRLAYDLLPKID